MMRMDSRAVAFLLSVVAIAVTSNGFVAHAFTPMMTPRPMAVFGVPLETTRMVWSSETRLRMAKEHADDNANHKDDETAVNDDESTVVDKGDDATVEAVAVDPEVVTLKQEIANLESSLKAKKRELQYASDKAEEFSKGGYARRVAEMENMRRMRSMMNSSNKETAMASVLQNFLPVLDQLQVLRATYGDDEFGAKYNAVSGTMNSALKDMGVQEFTAEVGTKVDARRVTVVQEEHSTEFPPGTILKVLQNGMELQGNVMRLAECVVSTGSPAALDEAHNENVTADDNTDDDVESTKEDA